MNIVRKSVFLALSSLSMATMAGTSNVSLYEKLYRLAEKVYYIEYSLNADQRQMTDELSSRIDAIISTPNDITCGIKTEVMKEAYKWAYSTGGLNESSSEAEKFSVLVSNKYCPAAYFNLFKAAYKFAYETDGMNKTKSEAKKSANKISDYEDSKYYTKNALQCYIENYTYAYSSGGMNKTRSEAEAFANKQCLEYGEKVHPEQENIKTRG